MDPELQQLKQEFEDFKLKYEEHRHTGLNTQRVSDRDLEPNGNKHLEGAEVKTNQTWIDGKPIYREIVNFGSLPNSGTKAVSTIVGSKLDTLTNMIPVRASSGTHVVGNSKTSVNYVEWSFNNTNQIECNTNWNATSWTAKVVIEYTTL